MPVLEDKTKRKVIRSELYEQLERDGLPIKDTVKKLRQIMGMDQEKFAEKVGMSLSALRRIEQDQQNFNLATLHRILDLFQLQLVVKKK